MSEFLQRLRGQARELTTLGRDLRVRSEERVDWGRTTKSSAVAGVGIPVERSFLADYFLTTWTEWRSLYERYPRYFGRPLESIPLQWHRTADHCRHLAASLFRDGSLGDILATTWAEQEAESGSTTQNGIADGPDAVALYRGIVRSHLRLSALTAREVEDEDSAGTWRRCAEVARRADVQWQGVFSQAPEDTQGAVRWHLRHYRHSSLELSWLNGTTHSALGRLGDEDRPPTLAARSWFPALNLPDGKAQEVQRVLVRIGQAVAEIGYESFVEDVISKDFAGGPDSPLGSSDVTLVPGPRPERLASIVVGVTRGNKPRARLGFPTVMSQIKALLTAGRDQVAFVLVLCDTWDLEGFRSQHLGELHRFSPLPFLFLLVGSPDGVLAPAAVVGGRLSGTG